MDGSPDGPQPRGQHQQGANEFQITSFHSRSVSPRRLSKGERVRWGLTECELVLDFIIFVTVSLNRTADLYVAMVACQLKSYCVTSCLTLLKLFSHLLTFSHLVNDIAKAAH